MKKIILLIIPFLLISCFGTIKKENIEEAKRELLGEGYVEDKSKKETIEQKENDLEEKENYEEKKKQADVSQQEELIQMETLTDNQFLTLNDISEEDLRGFELEIVGEADQNVEKIEVEFHNRESDFPDDHYTLTQFQKGDKQFIYRASSNYQVFDYGTNEYIFRAFAGEEKSELKLTLIRKRSDESSDEKVSIKYEKQLFGTEDDTLYLSFPKSDSFGEMVKLGEDEFTYSKVDNLVVRKVKDVDYVCDIRDESNELTSNSVTTKLREKITTWFYWNTCRDIIKDKGISFYVLSLQGEGYIYEKHYVDFDHGFYGIYQLESGDGGIDKDNIQQKNSEFKDREFDTKVVDELFREIVR